MKFINSLLLTLRLPTVFAHCDIPCGVYDVQAVQMAAHTIIRMTSLINELQVSSQDPPFEERKKIIHDISRLARVKEEHGSIVEEELGTLENDYFKPEHYQEFPDLAELLKSTVKLSITTRQSIDAESAQKLLEGTQKIAEIFYKTKKLTPVRVPSGYPTGGEIVMHS